MSEPSPELRWAPIEPKPRNRGRIWLIVGLAIAGLAILGALVFFLLPHVGSLEPRASDSPRPTATASPSSPAEEPTPQTTPPSPADPTVDTFREQVGGWLSDAPQGLDIVSESNPDDALAVVDSLQQDARRLSDAPPPSSIDQKWRDGVMAYSQRLTELRAAILSESDTADSVDAARAAVQDLQSLVGL
ncbi:MULTISPECIES: hypothetical protein [unclassified Microbacterium]|uniref:hypothetical protein n=1 Tax=unclassified Microbacterium TaxID=2609290 RepID=UPI000492F808|nr:MULTISPECIES: hypothetical protein [unclassified Microbacterium]